MVLVLIAGFYTVVIDVFNNFSAGKKDLPGLTEAVTCIMNIGRKYDGEKIEIALNFIPPVACPGV